MQKITPKHWILFGIMGFPVLSFVSEIAGWLVFGALGLFKAHPFPEFGWGGGLGLLLGAPLGLISALTSFGWRNGQHIQSRIVAAGGALLIGGWWLSMLIQSNPFIWIGDFGFTVTPLAWAAGLLLFGILAKPEKALASESS